MVLPFVIAFLNIVISSFSSLGNLPNKLFDSEGSLFRL